MLDGVFGIDKFRCEIVWKRQGGQSNNVKSKFSIEHDIILFYSKSDIYTFSPVFKPHTQEYLDDFYHKTDADGRRYSETFAADSRNKEKKRTDYLDGLKGVIVGSLWTNTGLQLLSNAKERLGYPTQKPVALYERMIQASSNQHDIVLDPFAGSGTTLDAAHTLGRHWIGIDVGDAAIKTIQERMRNQHGLEYDRDYEIIRGTMTRRDTQAPYLQIYCKIIADFLIKKHKKV